MMPFLFSLDGQEDRIEAEEEKTIMIHSNSLSCKSHLFEQEEEKDDDTETMMMMIDTRWTQQRERERGC